MMYEKEEEILKALKELEKSENFFKQYLKKESVDAGHFFEQLENMLPDENDLETWESDLEEEESEY